MGDDIRIGKRLYESTTKSRSLVISDDAFAIIDAIEKLSREIRNLKNIK